MPFSRAVGQPNPARFEIPLIGLPWQLPKENEKHIPSNFGYTLKSF